MEIPADLNDGSFEMRIANDIESQTSAKPGLSWNCLERALIS